MAVYGIDVYGETTYGQSLSPAFIAGTMVAQAISYGTIQVTWTQPTGPIFRYRLIGNKYGFPVNENDGNVLIDSETYPGSSFLHQQIIPGLMYYYGLYVLIDADTDTWLRSGVTACLSVQNFGSAQWLEDRLPEYFTTLPDGSELDGSNGVPNSFLTQYLTVLGWGLDYVKTQYALLANHLNDPEKMPEDDLYLLAQELGMNFSSETEPYIVRRAVQNFVHVSQERGTTLGLQNEISLFTGWGVDAQAGPNLFLDDDQSEFLSPVWLPYEDTRQYVEGEYVWAGPAGVTPDTYAWTGLGYWYVCLEATHGVAPPGDGTSNANWQAVLDANDTLYSLTSPLTSNPSTWEALDPTTVEATVLPGSLVKGVGIRRPGFLTGSYAWNSLRVINQQSTTRNLWVRSVSRTNADISQIPDTSFETGATVVTATTGNSNLNWIPVPWPNIQVTVPGFPGQTFNSAQYWTSENATIVLSETEAHSGLWSVEVTPVAAGATAVMSPWIPVTAGTVYDAAAWGYAPSSLSHSVFTSIVWLDSNGAKISETDGSAAALTATVWGTRTATGTAPAGARYAYLMFSISSNAATSDVFYLDDTTIVATSSSDTVFAPDQLQATGDGIPVPWVRDSQLWDPETTYATQDVVLWRGQAFTALRASTGAEPPDLNAASPEWAPLGFDRRIRLLASAYTSQDQSIGTAEELAVTPFVEWYDENGNFINRVFARNPVAGSGNAARPDSLTFDSFTTPSTEFEGTVAVSPWAASFYNSVNLTGSVVLSREDNAIDFEFDSTSPGAGVNATGWSSKWLASFTAPASATYTFGVSSSDGSRIIVNGTTVVNNWQTQPTTHLAGTIGLAANTTVNVEVDYYKAEVPPEAWDISVTTFDDLKTHGWNAGEQTSWAPGVPALVQGNQATDAAGDVETILPLPRFGDTTVDGVVIPFPESHAVLVGGHEATSGTGDVRRIFYGPTFKVAPGTNVLAGSWSIDRGPGVTPYIQWIGSPTNDTDFDLFPDGTLEIPGTLAVTTGETAEDPIAWVLASVSGIAPPGTKYALLFVREFWENPIDTLLDLHPFMGPTFVATQPLEQAVPSGIVLDPITWSTSGESPSINGRVTDDRQNSWTVQDGSFLQYGYLEGTVAPADPTIRSVALVTGAANGNVGVTFRSSPPSGTDQGLVFRYSDDDDYWRAGRNLLQKQVSGSWISLGNYSTPFLDGDRMVVNLNGSSITVYRNGVSVLAVTDSFNDTATQHGIACEPEVIAGTGVYGSGLYGTGIYA